MKRVTASRAQRREAFLTLAGQAFDELEAWYEAHPEATFGEIEAKARAVRRTLMGAGLAVLINQRSHAHAAEVKTPSCRCCGASMKLQERRSKQVDGLEGRSAIERNYYVCPNGCGETAFPPGSRAAAAIGSVE
jgi:hypothetical protein